MQRFHRPYSDNSLWAASLYGAWWFGSNSFQSISAGQSLSSIPVVSPCMASWVIRSRSVPSRLSDAPPPWSAPIPRNAGSDTYVVFPPATVRMDPWPFGLLATNSLEISARPTSPDVVVVLAPPGIAIVVDFDG